MREAGWCAASQPTEPVARISKISYDEALASGGTTAYIHVTLCSVPLLIY